MSAMILKLISCNTLIALGGCRSICSRFTATRRHLIRQYDQVTQKCIRKCTCCFNLGPFDKFIMGTTVAYYPDLMRPVSHLVWNDLCIRKLGYLRDQIATKTAVCMVYSLLDGPTIRHSGRLLHAQNVKCCFCLGERFLNVRREPGQRLAVARRRYKLVSQFIKRNVRIPVFCIINSIETAERRRGSGQPHFNSARFLTTIANNASKNRTNLLKRPLQTRFFDQCEANNSKRLIISPAMRAFIDKIGRHIDPFMGDAMAQMNRRISMAREDATPCRAISMLHHSWQDKKTQAGTGTLGGPIGTGCAR